MKWWWTLALAGCLLCGCAALIRSSQEVLRESHREVLPAEFAQTYSPSELKEDLRFLIQTLEEVHPHLYAYISETDASQAQGEVEQEFVRPLSRIEFYFRIAPVVAALSDGHTRIVLPHEEYQEWIRTARPVFPLEVTVRNDRIFVSADYSSPKTIPEGAELISVNGVSASAIVAKTNPSIPAGFSGVGDCQIGRRVLDDVGPAISVDISNHSGGGKR